MNSLAFRVTGATRRFLPSLAQARGARNCTFKSRNLLFKAGFQSAEVFTTQPCRHFSRLNGEDSHSDFSPESKVKTDADDSDLQNFLKSAVESHDVLLFMKGSPEAPQCGFSAKVTQILRAHNVDFSSADVLANHEVREGIKKFSDWPTIPQLYINGEFVGGCDIVTDMHDNGELEEVLAPIRTKQKEEKDEE